MAQAKKGDTVLINFIGRMEDGSIMDSTYPEEKQSECGCGDGAEHNCGDDGDCCQDTGPFEIVIGEGDFYIPVEEELVGMQVGEKKTVTISPDDAFGDYNPENVFSVERSEFPDDIDPVVGMGLEVTGEDDELYMVTVIEVTDEQITLDTNHPLAGETLTYEVELAEIV
ncbi:peptidylprolyl isomerase [Malonomonas rubra DSM 5091]|uniref:Peptidyl-prolyl cis-trans isomerase n=1 Tax=Malonomonas rubra DSM 5091 TaxID=1122189 RepID=A0A1M6BUX9_MALRU|nr:peptidylprolyl isomerase [Malonomonas rubra]SHI52413.1 peptidylprolyl isomerase [Malonomonas rubra DSM 5091]